MYRRTNRVWRGSDLIVLDDYASTFFDEFRNGVRLGDGYVDVVFDERVGNLGARGNYTPNGMLYLFQVMPLPHVMGMASVAITAAMGRGESVTPERVDEIVEHLQDGWGAIRPVTDADEMARFVGAINRKDRRVKGSTPVMNDFEIASSMIIYA
ncbi:MAG: hypothetical protein QF486_03810 [Candidatus Woesearchaeota archaeon]|nr:hypothetical protein [Candidatus Woesearchaeota archaeon]MDP7181633.1 hypothetical protein [Candidatus Woesearchaeota archaeon]MDP7198722.1 hypothetical protein [Candidatus Woesearchaeota archaeon]MDP7467278.1 hypothetical protein [Candidatus Woesearchaeota archaeon]MDP7647387.1 hypothetical protein [Candidatus Woesearchaeota archaeon]